MMNSVFTMMDFVLQNDGLCTKMMNSAFIMMDFVLQNDGLCTKYGGPWARRSTVSF